jgi:transcriptional regulator with GAF, ATPase, and Fis domain
MYSISIFKGDGLQKTENIDLKRAVSIGRDTLNDIHLPDPAGEISLFHAALFYNAAEGYFIQDLGSRSNTFVNGQKKNYGRLAEGDKITIGNYTLVFQKKLSKRMKKPGVSVLNDAATDEDIETVITAVSSQLGADELFEGDAETLKLLYQFSRIANRNLELEENLQLIVEKLFKTFNPNRAFIALIEPDVTDLRCLASFPDHEMGMTVSKTMIKYLLKEKHAFVTENALTDKRFKKNGKTARSVKALQIKSVISVPLWWNGKIRAILYMDSSGKIGRFSEKDLKILTLIGNDISSLIERGVNYKAVQDEKTILENRLGTQHTIIGITSKTKNIIKTVARLSGTVVTVLITGETGTGKDLVARAIHKNSKRKEKPFIEVNCAAIPDNLMESELFGVIANYPGFHNNQLLKGKFQLADEGTIFLNEIGEMPKKLQAKLLDVFEKKQIWLLGGDRPIPIDVRIITATNKELQREVNDGNFREDLYERLNIFPVHIPSLRERKEDIPLLVGYFLYQLRHTYNKSISRVTNACIKTLFAQEWSGNIRELKNNIERAVILADRPTITPDLLITKNKKQILPKSLKDTEKDHIMRVLEYTEGNKEKARRILRISKQTLYNKGREYNIPAFEKKKSNN